MASELLQHLNPTQREAATYLDGPLMIIAGAGSGKTRVISHRIAFLVQDVAVPMGEILAVTFTNKAAKEMRERVFRLLGVPEHHGLAIGTFHARCAFILRCESAPAGLSKDFTILDESDQFTAVKLAMEKLGVGEKKVRPNQVQNFINLAKMKLLTPEETLELEEESPIPYGKLYAAYEEILKKNRGVDFEGLIFKTVRLLQQHEDVRRKWSTRYRHILVDEFQDTNHSQFLLTSLLARDHQNICIVGDEDQSIYSWRGAEISNLLDFEKHFPRTKIIRLEHNYRSDGNILKLASAVIRHNTQRLGKELFTDRGDGDPIRYLRGEDENHEAQLVAIEVDRLIHGEAVPPEDIAIFYRSHRLSRAPEDQLRRLGIPYRIVGGLRFYDRAEIKDTLSFLRLALYPGEDLSFLRVVNKPKRGIGDRTVSQLQEIAATRGLSLYDAAVELLRRGDLGAKATGNLQDFLDQIAAWQQIAPSVSASEMVERVLTDTRYREEALGDPDSLDAQSRTENIEEFLRVAAEFTTEEEGTPLRLFLQSLSLDAAMTGQQTDQPSVSLMSVHNAKGLEFDYVFVIGLDEGLFPNSLAMNGDDSITGLEEERRLFYVAATRARRRLFLTRASRRLTFGGGFGMAEPSRFLREVPTEVLDKRGAEALRRDLPYSSERLAAPMSPGTPSTGARLFGATISKGMPTAAANGNEFTPGTRVRHAYMGTGIVYKVAGRPPQHRLYIRFDDGREQSFIGRHAPITREDS